MINFELQSEKTVLRYSKVKAAIAEGEAIMRGDIPAKWHKPHELEEVLNELLKD